VFQLVRRALREDHYWTPREIHPNYRGADVWSTANLASFFEEFSPFPTPMMGLALRQRVPALLAIYERRMQASELLRGVERLLTTEAA
jgi:hypothetical protein